MIVTVTARVALDIPGQSPAFDIYADCIEILMPRMRRHGVDSPIHDVPCVHTAWWQRWPRWTAR